jgi:hypothetical protein
MMGTPESAFADAHRGAAEFLRERTSMESAARQLPLATIKVTASNLSMAVVFIILLSLMFATAVPRQSKRSQGIQSEGGRT